MPVFITNTFKDEQDLQDSLSHYAIYGTADHTEKVPTVWHAETCPHRDNNGYRSSKQHECCDDHGCKPNLFVRFTFMTGRVISIRERNMHDDSDYIALVWDGEQIREIEYATTRFWTYLNAAEVDATPETMLAALAWWRKDRLPYALAQWEEDARTFAPGKWVQILKGRKHKDKIGRCGMIITRARNMYAHEEKYDLLLALDSPDRKRADVERIWIAESNCAVVDYGEVPTALIVQQVSASIPTWYRPSMKELQHAA